MATFTIGIPTFNRAHWVGSAIECALAQTYHDIEVIVSDNASTDSTAEVVQRFGDRVRYVRNAENVGAWRNLCQLVNLAKGQYFSWLQDDDCIFNHFAQRAVHGFAAFPQANMYGAYAAVSGNLKYMANSWLYGPPLQLDWNGGSPRVMRGDMLAPLALCVSVAIPPVVAFRTAELRECIPRCNQAIPLYVERTILADLGRRGDIIFGPQVAGVFRAHSKQSYRVMQKQDPSAQSQQWLEMARELDRLFGRATIGWRRRLVASLAEVSDDHRGVWEAESRTWPTDIALCREMRQALLVNPEPLRVPLSPSGIFRAGTRVARSLLSGY